MSLVEIKAADAKETRKALRLTLATRGQSSAQLECQVTALVQYARAMSLDLNRHWLYVVDGQPVAGCTFIESPGRTAVLLMTDGDVARLDPQDLSDLVQHTIDQIADRDLLVLQCLIRPDDGVNRAALEHVGFHEVAVLVYMEWAAQTLPSPFHRAGACRPGPARHEPALQGESPGEGPCDVVPADPKGRTTQWITYDQTHHDEFACLISATYEASLDCPGLTGLREIDNVIAGHKAAGRFDPRRWLLLRHEGQAAGCILFGENPLKKTLELVYMGVRPELRHRGIGRRLLGRGLSLAGQGGFTTVTVAVDANNAPAMTLYRTAAFRETTRRRAMILPLAPDPSLGRA